MSKEHLLQRLQPVDFRAVADRGAFVYCYLRSADLSPYYVGISINWQRPFGDHTCNIPPNPALVRLLRSGLTYEEAQEWEITYIAHYGRVDLGTGILRNLTDGGEGMTGHGLAEFAEKASLTIEEARTWTALERRCFHEYRKRLPDATGAEWRAQRQLGRGKARAIQLQRDAAERHGIDFGDYLDLGPQGQQNLRLWLDRNPDCTGQDYIEFLKLPTNTTLVLQMQEEAAQRWGVSLEQWQAFTESDKKALPMWLKAHPDKTAQDWLHLKTKGPNQSRTQSIHRAKAAKYQIDLAVWASLTENQKTALRAFLRVHPETTGQQYAERRGWA